MTSALIIAFWVAIFFSVGLWVTVFCVMYSMHGDHMSEKNLEKRRGVKKWIWEMGRSLENVWEIKDI